VRQGFLVGFSVCYITCLIFFPLFLFFGIISAGRHAIAMANDFAVAGGRGLRGRKGQKGVKGATNRSISWQIEGEPMAHGASRRSRVMPADLLEIYCNTCRRAPRHL